LSKGVGKNRPVQLVSVQLRFSTLRRFQVIPSQFLTGKWLWIGKVGRFHACTASPQGHQD